ncbi:Amino acid/polyamine transporter I [Phytophthora cactorum]|nr:Amino acid/polyamine transporter I [Phytophthora cactorum]
MLARDAFSYALPSANNRPMRKNAQPVLAFLVSEAYAESAVCSLDIQESKVEPPQRHAKALQLWALGIGAVISGEYYGWQSSLVAGFNGMLIVMSMMTVLYVMLSFSLAELSATIPAGGGPYIFALHSIGPRAAFFSGLAETLKVITVNSSTFYTIYSYLQTLFNVDEKVRSGVLHRASFRMQACSTAALRAVAAHHYTESERAIEAIPYAMWFYLGIEELPLASEETIEPEKNIPRGLFMCISTRGPFPSHAVFSADAPVLLLWLTCNAARYELSDRFTALELTTTFFKCDDGHLLCSSPNSYVFFMGQLLFAIAETPRTAVGALLFGTISCVVIAVVLHYAMADDDLGSVLIT